MVGTLRGDGNPGWKKMTGLLLLRRVRIENSREKMLKSNYVADHGRWWSGVEWIGVKPR